MLLLTSLAFLCFVAVLYYGIQTRPMKNYEAIWGTSLPDCVEILQEESPSIPLMDYSYVFHIKCCPEELKRILSRENFTIERVESKELNRVSTGKILDWYKPWNLGNVVLVYTYQEGYGKGATIYSNLTMTEAYCIKFIN